MGEVDFEVIIDAVRKEIALAPIEAALREAKGFAAVSNAARDKYASRRHASSPRIRRVGEGRKRYR